VENASPLADAPRPQTPRKFRAWRGWVGLAVAILVLGLGGGCQDHEKALLLSNKAKGLWEAGQYADAARNFITLAELHSRDPLAEESLFWAANLFQHVLSDPGQAIRYYQHLLVQYPKGRFAAEGKENLAALYEADKGTRHRALQIYQQLLLDEKLKERRDYFQFKIASLNLKMGKLDQSRYEFRTLLTQYPKSPRLPDAYYLVGYSYFLEQRFPLALVAFNQTVRDFPGTPQASQAQFFIADTLEEQGKLKQALKTFRALKGKYHNERILDKRIAALRARMRKSVR
jgi:TolA-binding protein